MLKSYGNWVVLQKRLDFFEKFAIILQACDRGYKAVTYDKKDKSDNLSI